MHRLPYNPITRADYIGREPHSIAVLGHLAENTIIHPRFKVPSSSGGSAAAVATAVIQLGIDTAIYSEVGKDFPKEWLSVLNDLGIDISGIKISEKKKNLQVTFKYDENVNLEKIKCNDVKLMGLKFKSLPNVECVHLCPTLPEEQIEILKNLKDKTDFLSTNFSEYFIKDYKKKNFFENMPWNAVDIVFINEKEGRAITKCRSSEKMAGKLHDAGIGIVVIIMDKKGSLVYRGGDIPNIPSREVEILDPTGCKESYIGGFLGEYLISKNVRKAAGMGTYFASLTAQKKGSWAALLSDTGVRF
jgi:sugar/nucleoside kinase (ribokinase family)